MSRRDLGQAGEMEAALGELEALLFAAGKPWSTPRIARKLVLSEVETVSLLGELASGLKVPSRGLQLREASGNWSLETKREHEDLLASVRIERGQKPLSMQALECLSVIARKGPVTTENVTETRGKESYAPLLTLHKRGLIAKTKTDGRTGRGARWQTTAAFLERSGFRNLGELEAHMDGVFALREEEKD